jgi:predicted porin
MKKSLIALISLAALTVAGIASAQSSVTVFGVIDINFNSYSNKSQNANGETVKLSMNQLTNAGYSTSRLGFRGTEDLGGGLAASFWLEAGLSPDDGVAGGNVANSGASVTGFFNRRSTVSLSGPFGEIRLGRDYTPTFWNNFFDPFNGNGVGTNLKYTASSLGAGSPPGFSANNMFLRASNSIGYFLPPNLGGFYGQLMYAFDESTKTTSSTGNSPRAGRYLGGRLGYTNGSLDIAGAYGEASTADDLAAGRRATAKSWNIGASYDFKVVKLFGEVGAVKNDNALANPKVTGWLLGVTAPVGPGLIRAGYSTVKYGNVGAQEPKAGKWALGYVYNLSKRTALYATAAYVSNKNNESTRSGLANNGSYSATAGFVPKRSTAYDLGIRHSF